MPNNVTTTRNGFPVYDVTHKPRRTQSSNLKQALGDTQSPEVTEEGVEVPSVVTIERAIRFYETHAEGSYKTLYLQTAKWLRDLMSKNIPVDVGTDVDKAQELLDRARGR